MSSLELNFSRPLIILARIIAIIFHPLLVGAYMAFYLIYINPSYYAYVPRVNAFRTLLAVANNNFVFPVLVVLLMRGLGFIKSIQLKTTRDRIIPYMASIVFFFWTWNTFYHLQDTPQIMRDMTQGIFYAAVIGMIANIYFKISMHAMGVGGLVGLMIIVLLDGQMYSGIPLAISLLIAGLVMSSRMITGDHERGDILAGFLVGLMSQLIASWII
jgi:hypothetical protein